MVSAWPQITLLMYRLYVEKIATPAADRENHDAQGDVVSFARFEVVIKKDT